MLHAHTSAANYLPARCPCGVLRDGNTGLILSAGHVTSQCYSWEFIESPLNSHCLTPNEFHICGLMKKHLDGKQFATDVSMNMSPPGYRHVTQISSIPG